MIEFDHILNQLPYLIFWKNKNLEYVGANTHFLKNAGLHVIDEILGKNDYHMPWDCFAEKYRQDDKKVLSKTKPLCIQEQHRDISASITKVMVTKKPLYDVNGAMIGIIGIFYPVCHKMNVIHKDCLPKRQKEVLIAIANGMSAKAIGLKLGISVRTVEYYIELIKSKLNCHNKAELIKSALLLGLVP